MRKIYSLEDLDCANCASKMESRILKIEGVKFASVNFMTQKLVVEADDNIFEDLMNQIVKVCKKIEPDCCIKR